MIKLSNGRSFEYMIASGALAFDGKGWLWDWPLRWLGLIDPKLFAIVLKTVTLLPRKGNLRMYKPWECVSIIQGGSVNKIGLTNKGFPWLCEKIIPNLDPELFIVVSIFGETSEMVTMAEELNWFPNIAGIELNPACPNTGHALAKAEVVIEMGKAVKAESKHPLIIKVSVDQDYLAISQGLKGIADAVSLNSVPYATAFPGQISPLHPLEKRVGGGGGGVSGRPAQEFNWEAAEALAKQHALPVIVPSIMEFDDLARVRKFCTDAVSFGAIHLPDYPVWLKPWTLFTNPCKPTRFVRREEKA